MTDLSGAPQPPLQPLLDDAVIALRAPTQVWSGSDGDLGAAPIHGVYHGDVRHIRALSLSCPDSPLEWISTAPDGLSRVVFGALLRGLDDASPDPKVRLRRERTVSDGGMRETYVLASAVDEDAETELVVRITPEFGSLHEVKAGAVSSVDTVVEITETGARARSQDRAFEVTAPGARVDVDTGGVELRWHVHLPARGRAEVSWRASLTDPTLVVRGAGERWTPSVARTTEPRLDRWLEHALGDLDALRLTLADDPHDVFFAAGAPWFLTLFGRDSLWAARLVLPVDAGPAASTLRVLARLQGTSVDDERAEDPGKILHEVRATALELPGEGVVLPPLYYGSVDSTPLWVCLLVDAWRAGMAESEVRALVPALRRALRWIVEVGDSDGDGFLDYIDRSGRGLANQGWKDSGDSIQWRDGQLADGPIALCEVQGYAYEAALGGADVLEELADDPDEAARLRSWAAELKDRFAEAYWVETPEGRYPAIALDRDKRPVDTLTSNIGHLVGTGILSPADEADVARLLVGDALSSGYGIRTMSSGSAGYWPLSYHGGSVWTHDTAIVARGLARAGLDAEARAVVDGMLAAAEGFGWRVPELHSGDPASETSVPTPYPAACRPQAWSAAAAVTCLAIVAGPSLRATPAERAAR